MIWTIERVYGLDAPEVFLAMLQVPREKFAPSAYKHLAYKDGPVPIGYAQTMSQPYTVAFMTNLLLSSSLSLPARLDSAKRTGKAVRKKSESLNADIKNWKVLEVGTGSGYQAAILSNLVKEVYTIERIKDLAEKAKKRLKKTGV